MLLLTILLFCACATGAFIINAKVMHRTYVLTPFLMFVLFEIIFAWPATIYCQLIHVADATPAILMGVAFVGYLIAFVVSLRVLQVKPDHVSSFNAAPIAVERSEGSYAALILCMSALLFGLALYLHQGIPPMMSIAADYLTFQDYGTGVSDLSSTREEVTKGHYFGAAYRGQGVILEAQQIGWPMLLIVAFQFYLHTKRKRWLIASGMLLTLALLSVGIVGRFQIMMVFLCLLTALTLNLRFNARNTTTAAITVLLLVFLVNPLSIQMASLDTSDRVVRDNIEGASMRVLMGNGMTNIEVMDFIDDGALHYQNGQLHWNKLLAALPGVSASELPFSYQIQRMRVARSNDTTYASMTYFGILYADFGPIGVILGYAVLGIATAMAHRYLFGFPKGILEIPVVAIAITYFGDISLGSTVSVAATFVMLAAIYGLLRMMQALLALAFGKPKPAQLGTAFTERQTVTRST